MAGLFDKQAEIYAVTRPTYPSQWYRMLADLTPQHSLAWDAGTGNGQAAVAVGEHFEKVIGTNASESQLKQAMQHPRVEYLHQWCSQTSVAEHYEKVIGTDVSLAQLMHAMQHPRVEYLHTPLSITDDELLILIGGDNSVDLITVAQAIHWFELPKFYSLVGRLLRKPGGIFAVWGYSDIKVSPTFDPVMKRFLDSTLPFWNPKVQYVFDGYTTLPFPFENVGLGSEGEPVLLGIPKELSFEAFLGMLRSCSAVTTAKEQGVDLLSEKVVEEFQSAWGGSELVRSVTYKAFMLAGKVKL